MAVHGQLDGHLAKGLREALPGGGGPRSLVGILKCLVSAFCQGFMSLSEIERHTFVLVPYLSLFNWALSLLFGPCRLSEFTLAGPLQSKCSCQMETTVYVSDHRKKTLQRL